MSQAGYIYAIGATGSPWVKIGCTSGAVATRLRTLQTGHPLPLYIITTVAVPAYLHQIERHVHALLKAVPREGEWFDVTIEADAFSALVTRATVRATQKRGLPLSQRVQLLRQRKGWNQVELADRAGVKQSILSRIEGGSRPNPTIDVVRKLAQALGCTTDYLIGMYEDNDSTVKPAAVAMVGA